MVGKCRCEKIGIAAFILITLAFGCSRSVPKEIPLLAATFESGDLIFRKGNGFFSQYFADAGSRQKRYSHVGILFRQGDSVFVYHIEADEFSGKGNMKKEPLKTFLQDIKVFKVRNLAVGHEIRKTIIRKADSLLEKKVGFDMDFDYTTHDKFYCTELVAYILNSSTPSFRIKPTWVLNHQKYYSVDDIYFSKLVKN